MESREQVGQFVGVRSALRIGCGVEVRRGCSVIELILVVRHRVANPSIDGHSRAGEKVVRNSRRIGFTRSVELYERILFFYIRGKRFTEIAGKCLAVVGGKHGRSTTVFSKADEE